MKIYCHCKNVSVEAKSPEDITDCNCSICRRYQALWGYYKPKDVVLKVGEFGVAEYTHGDRELNFVRCAQCGCVTHYVTAPDQKDPVFAVNYRMADTDQLDGIPIVEFNGKDLL